MDNDSVVIQANLDDLSDYSIQLNRWFLKPIGAWPVSSSNSIIDRIVSLLLIFVCYWVILITVIPCVFYLCLEDEDILEKLKMAGTLSHWIIGGINYTTLLLRNKEIRQCLDHMKTDWLTASTTKVQRVMLRDAKFGRFVAIVLAIFMQIGILCYCVLMAFTTKLVQVGNETKKLHSLPITAYSKLVVLDTSPTKEIFLVIQWTSAFIANSTAVGAFSLAAVFAAHAQGQLNILMMRITEFVNESREPNKKSHSTTIPMIVDHHVRTLSFISYIEDVLNQICLTELFRCTLAICFLSYFILTDWKHRVFKEGTTYVIILCSICFNIFTLCYIGEKLTEQCKKVGEVVYMSNWYFLPDKDILDLMLIISRSSTVTKITAGKLMHMSIYTFSDVVKTSFAYMSVMQQMT